MSTCLWDAASAMNYLTKPMRSSHLLRGISFSSHPYAQHGARTHAPEIKSLTLHHQSARHTRILISNPRIAHGFKSRKRMAASRVSARPFSLVLQRSESVHNSKATGSISTEPWLRAQPGGTKQRAGPAHADTQPPEQVPRAGPGTSGGKEGVLWVGSPPFQYPGPGFHPPHHRPLSPELVSPARSPAPLRQQPWPSTSQSPRTTRRPTEIL